MTHSTLLHRCTRPLLLMAMVAWVAVDGPHAQSAQAREQAHVVVGQVVDEPTHAVPDICPDVLELVTGNPSLGQPSPTTVDCLAVAAAQGVQLPTAGAPCEGVHVATGTPLVVRDGDHHLLARATLHDGHLSTAGDDKCVFAFSAQVPTRAAYVFVLSPDRWVSYRHGALRSAHWHAGLQV